MISEKSKKKIKEIKQLKDNNWQKKYQTFSMYYKEFKRPISHQNPFNRKIQSSPKKDNFFIFVFGTKILLFIKMMFEINILIHLIHM